MDIAFLDSSAFFKLYRPEIGSNWLKVFLADKQIIMSQLVLAEVATIVGRLYREGVYTKDDAIELYSLILTESRRFEIHPLGSDEQMQGVISLVFDLPVDIMVRALDGIHLAVAKIVQDEASLQTPPVPLTFITADKNLVKAARAAGFAVENPNDHL